MKRWMPSALAAQGLLLAVILPASAQKTVKLFGNTYGVVCAPREQTYKTAAGKQVKITVPPGEDEGGTWTQKSALSFYEGADPSQDRLLVGAHLDNNDGAAKWHNLYMLTGAGPDGMFSPASATLTEFFGGQGDRLTGGRPLAVMLLNLDETGVKKDRNVLALQWTDANGYRLFDLDSMKTNFKDDGLFFGITSELESDPDSRFDASNNTFDENAVHGGWMAFAPIPNYDGHTIVAIGTSPNGGLEAGMWNTRTNTFFPVTSDLAIQDDVTVPHGLVHVSGDEYLILASDVAPNGGGASVGSQKLFRVRLTLPADPAKGKPGDIKSQVLGKEELVGTALRTSPGMNLGLAIGREVKNGLRRLYFGTLDGQICVVTPQ